MTEPAKRKTTARKKKADLAKVVAEKIKKDAEPKDFTVPVRLGFMDANDFLESDSREHLGDFLKSPAGQDYLSTMHGLHPRALKKADSLSAEFQLGLIEGYEIAVTNMSRLATAKSKKIQKTTAAQATIPPHQTRI